MRIRVLKFGGTSLTTRARRAAAVARVREAREEGTSPVVVVSALGRRGDPYATDTLLEMVRDDGVETTPRELAMLASCGEVVAAVVFAGALRAAGIPASTLTGAQAGIRTVRGYAGAVILSLDPGGILQCAGRGVVPVVTGYQGATPAGEVTVLQRGGSDISGTALGYALGAERVEIFTDVPGVMTADPRLVPEARTIGALSFREALLLARSGARVVHPQALRWAMRGPTPVHVRATDGAEGMSRIGEAAAEQEAEGDGAGVLGIASRVAGEDGRAVVSVVGSHGALDAPAMACTVRETLEMATVPIFAIDPAAGVVSATIPETDTARGARALHALFLGESRSAVAGIAG